MDVQSSQSSGKISSIDPVKEYQANLLDYVMSSGNTSDPEFNRWLDWYIESFFKKNYGEDRAKQLLADPVTKPSYRKYFTEQVLSRGANFEPVMRTPEQIESIRQQEQRKEVEREVEAERFKSREEERMRRQERERENIRRRIMGLPSLEQEEAEKKRAADIEARKKFLEDTRARMAEIRQRHSQIAQDYMAKKPKVRSTKSTYSLITSPDGLMQRESFVS